MLPYWPQFLATLWAGLLYCLIWQTCCIALFLAGLLSLFGKPVLFPYYWQAHYVTLFGGQFLVPYPWQAHYVANLPPNSAPFCSFSGGGESGPLTHGSFVRNFKELVSSIGLDPNEYSGHSFALVLLHLGLASLPSISLLKHLGIGRHTRTLGTIV